MHSNLDLMLSLEVGCFLTVVIFCYKLMLQKIRESNQIIWEWAHEWEIVLS